MCRSEQDIKYLKGVGPKRAEMLNKDLNIFSLEDLLNHFPYRYVDKTKLYKVSEVQNTNAGVKLYGKISDPTVSGAGKKRRLTATFNDKSGSIELVWFAGIDGIKRLIQFGNNYYIFGQLSRYAGKLNMVHPELIRPEEDKESYTSEIEGIYSVSERMKKNFMSSKTIRKLQGTVLKMLASDLKETLPPYLREKMKLLNRKEAYINIHFPADHYLLKKARYRFIFEELFFLQLDVLRKRENRKTKFRGYQFSKVGEHFNNFYKEALPFELTGAQKRVIKEIRRDMGSGKQANRLLQGDVGSGKTLVALMCALIAADNGFQTALMAPTEVLAVQHAKTIAKFLDKSSIKLALLTGSTKTAERRKIHEDLLNGNINILTGTHALLEDEVRFKNLGLVIIDEQHRFGVAQRAKMWKKNNQPPHNIIMTATPIPRTLAMTIYGDLDVSIIDELPPGRKPVKTFHAYDSQRLRVFNFLRKQISQGRQVYIVYPLIQESEKWDYKDLEDGLESISRAFPPPKYALSVVHGKMTAEEKNKSMSLFKRGQTQIMIATTVIEVGVDVPNASVMLIESAERFGLSQLHQLRGRVGRGADQSYCILMSSYKLSQTARTRIGVMCETNNGFKIAEEDLKLRGQGDLEGTQQSGIPLNLKISDLQKDADTLMLTRKTASEILEEDPTLDLAKNSVLKTRLKQLNLSKHSWGIIG
jgi:ATP-dependent DNA helicase RecG